MHSTDAEEGVDREIALAVRKGRLQEAKALIKKTQEYPIPYARKHRYFPILHELIMENDDPIFFATFHQDWYTLNELIKRGKDVNVDFKTSKGIVLGTPLHIVVNTFIFKYLEDTDYDEKSIGYKEGDELERQNLCIDIINCLIRANADIDNIKGPRGYAPLHIACMHIKPVLVKLLLENNASVKVSNDTTGLQPLHTLFVYAEAHTQEERKDVQIIAYLLLLHGAEIDKMDKQNKTVDYYAKQNGMYSLLDNAKNQAKDHVVQSNNNISSTLHPETLQININNTAAPSHIRSLLLRPARDSGTVLLN